MDPRKYGLYILAGSLPWSFICESINAGCDSILASESFHKKLKLPKVFFPVVASGIETVTFSLSLISLYMICIAFGVRPEFEILFLPAAIIILALFNTGLSILFSIGTVFFRDLPHITKVALGLFFYLTPIIYPLDMIPEDKRFLFKLNPFWHFIDLFRSIILHNTIPEWSRWFICLIFAFVTISAALVVAHRKDRELVFRL